jgi:hypothetical protein
MYVMSQESLTVPFGSLSCAIPHVHRRAFHHRRDTLPLSRHNKAAYLLLHTRIVSLASTITRSDLSTTYDSTSCYPEQVDQSHEIQRTRSGSVFCYRSCPVQRLAVCCISSYHQIRQFNPQWVSPTEQVSLYVHMH